MINNQSLSRYLDDLPAIYSQEPAFLGRFLLAFEHVLTGVGDGSHSGLEEILEGIDAEDGSTIMAGAHRYITPGPAQDALERAPVDFLQWLSGWVALTLRDDWNEEEQRRIIAEIVPAYQKRGTSDGLKHILAAFAGVDSSAITITENREPFELGVSSIVGEDNLLGGMPPHRFTVTALLPGATDQERRRTVIKAIIDLEKPAHTYYNLRIQTPTMRVGVTSTIGADTVLGVPVELP